MTNEERDLISQFVARVGGAASGGFSRSVVSQANLPPIDPEADRFIAEQFATHPEARYRITQMAVVQEAALAEAANRIQQLQQALQAAQQQQHAQPAQSRGIFGSLFGGGQAAPQQQQSPWNQGQSQPGYAPQPQYAPQPPQYPPNMQPGMFQRSGGSGFLGSALTTAAGVAGGVVAGNALMDLFSGGHGGGFGGGGFGGGMPGETIVNNYGDAAGYADPGAGAPDGGGWDNSTQGNAGWDGGGLDNSGGLDSGGGFDGGGGGFDDNSL